MSNYGDGLYGGGLFGGGSLPAFPPLVPTQIWVYTKTGTFKRMYQSGASCLVAINFTHSLQGCNDFQIEFSTSVDIDKSDIIKIKIFDFFNWIFTGVVRTVPLPGSTEQRYVYSGYGLNDYFKRINSGEYTQSAKTIGYILDDILDTLVTANCLIVKNNGKIVPPVLTLTTFNGHYVQVEEMLDALVKIANSTGDEYLYGVDQFGEFFFRPRSTEVMAVLSTGRSGDYGIPEYKPTDESEERSSLIVLKKDGTYWTTLDGDGDPDIYQEKVTGPDIADADLTLWATGILKDKERTLRSAVIEWALFENSPVIVSDGFLRIISTVPPMEQLTGTLEAWGDGVWGDGIWGGGALPAWTNIDDTLAIKQVTYRIDAQTATREIALGAIPLRLEDAIVSIERKQIDMAVSLGR